MIATSQLVSNPHRVLSSRRRLVVMFLLVGAGVSVTLVLLALNENINMFYPPEAVVAGEAPVGAQIRAGGILAAAAAARADGDFQGDYCDTDDGLIYLLTDDPAYVQWDEEEGYAAWNLYRGDLTTLVDSGLYTQSPGSNPLAGQECGLSDTFDLIVDVTNVNRAPTLTVSSHAVALGETDQEIAGLIDLLSVEVNAREVDPGHVGLIGLSVVLDHLEELGLGGLGVSRIGIGQ